MRLGHIVYSNCFPPHARLLDRPEPGDPPLVEGVPSLLNELLARGAVDVAPASSIEYALHADRYRILPDLTIASRGAVRSIVFLSREEPGRLDGQTVAVPTASATSVVLLRILLRTRWGSAPVFRWFDQAREDPFASGADAALFIGDVALGPERDPTIPLRFDLGLEWWRETGLPFAFALWQASAGSPGELRRLHRTLLDSRRYGAENAAPLARRHHERFGMEAGDLERYWCELVYDLQPDVIEGLRRFYLLAAEIGAIPRAPELRWLA